MHSYILHTCIHSYIHTHIHTCILRHTYIQHTHMHSFITYMHGYMHTYNHAYTDIHTHINTYIPSHTYMHTYMHTYVHTYLHTLITPLNSMEISNFPDRMECICCLLHVQGHRAKLATSAEKKLPCDGIGSKRDAQIEVGALAGNVHETWPLNERVDTSPKSEV